MTEERFVKNIGHIHFLYVLVCKIQSKNALDKLVKHFPTKKDELEHYCYQCNFGKVGDEYTSYEDFYKQLIQ